MQNEKMYSQFKTWKEITYPGEISYTQFNNRLTDYLGNGTWSSNKCVILTEQHKSHRESFGKQIILNKHEHFWSIRFGDYKYSVFQDEALFPGKTPVFNPQQKFKYDLWEPDPDKKLGHKPAYS